MSRALVGSYQLGTVAFTVGTAVWGIGTYLGSGRIDVAAVAYGVGCLYFIDDAFKLFARKDTTKRAGARAWLPNSYQAGSVAYAAGTVIWGVTGYVESAAVDPAALLYGIGCLYFLIDAFRRPAPVATTGLLGALARWAARVPLTSTQIGTLAFLVGTIVWGITGGVSFPVAAYGLGCLFFVRDAFRRKPEPAVATA